MSDGGIVLGAQHAPSPCPPPSGEGSERHQPLSFRNNTLTPLPVPSRSKLGLVSFQRDIPCGDDGDAADLQDFAIGFALTQGIIASAAEIESSRSNPSVRASTAASGSLPSAPKHCQSAGARWRGQPVRRLRR